MSQPTPSVVPPEHGVGMKWRQQAERLLREAQVFYFAFKHPRVPWGAKLVAACTAGYLFSPIQLIPSFIPVVGLLDDFLALFLAAKLIQRIIPPDVFTECRELADAAGMRRKDEIRSLEAVVAFIVISALWLLAAITASRVIGAYVFR